MSFSNLPLGYCTNVHPGRSVAEVQHGLDRYTCPVRDRLAVPIAAGLWLAQPVIQELRSTPDGVARFAAFLTDRDLSCHTLNCFPYGDFHDTRVKENVYLPDWSQPTRLQYTLECASVLAALLPEGVDGSLSTVPLGFKQFDHPDDFLRSCCDQLIDVAQNFDQLFQETGKRIRLAIEPEPMCVLETTPETLEFFELMRNYAADQGALEVVQQYLGVCYDVCHQAVEFEDVAASIQALSDVDVRINKVHITCALQLDNPATNVEGRNALAQFAEPRYLHQTLGRARNGDIRRFTDLSSEFARNPSDEFAACELWRIHFHVPVDAEQLGPLMTTRQELKQALAAVEQLEYSPHLEVETYTWQVLPNQEKVDFVDGISQELKSTHALLDSKRS